MRKRAAFLNARNRNVMVIRNIKRPARFGDVSTWYFTCGLDIAVFGSTDTRYTHLICPAQGPLPDNAVVGIDTLTDIFLFFIFIKVPVNYKTAIGL